MDNKLTPEELKDIKNSSLEEILGFDPFEITDRDYENIDEEIKKIEEYIDRLNEMGIHTEWQKKDLEFNQNLLKELKAIKK